MIRTMKKPPSEPDPIEALRCQISAVPLRDRALGTDAIQLSKLDALEARVNDANLRPAECKQLQDQITEIRATYELANVA